MRCVCCCDAGGRRAGAVKHCAINDRGRWRAAADRPWWKLRQTDGAFRRGAGKRVPPDACGARRHGSCTHPPGREPPALNRQYCNYSNDHSVTVRSRGRQWSGWGADPRAWVTHELSTGCRRRRGRDRAKHACATRPLQIRLPTTPHPCEAEPQCATVLYSVWRSPSSVRRDCPTGRRTSCGDDGDDGDDGGDDAAAACADSHGTAAPGVRCVWPRVSVREPNAAGGSVPCRRHRGRCTECSDVTEHLHVLHARCYLFGTG